MYLTDLLLLNQFKFCRSNEPDSLSATAAWSSVKIHQHVSQLTGKTVTTINQLSVNHDSRSYACSEGEFCKVFSLYL